MATNGPPAGPPPPGQQQPQQIPPQILQLMTMEAQKRGMTLEEFQAFQRRTIEEEAQKLGITPQEFVQRKQAEAREQMMKQRAAAEAQGQAPGQAPGQPPAQGQGQPQPQQRMQQLDITKPVEAKPEALAVAKFLRAQNLKTRTCIFNGQRKDMFKGEYRPPKESGIVANEFTSQARPPGFTVRRLQEGTEERPAYAQGRKRT